MISTKDFYNVFWSAPKCDGTEDVDHKLLGKLLIHDGRIDVLSDHYGFLADLPHSDAKIDPKTQRKLDRLFNSSYVNVVSKADLQSGKRPDIVPAPLPELPQQPPADGGDMQPATSPDLGFKMPAPVFDYHRVGMDRPHTIELNGQQVLLDGNLLSHDEALTVLNNIKTGVATIRHKQKDPLTSLQKMEQALISLHKAEGLAGSMDQLRALVQAGHLKPEHYDNIRKELYQDEMTPLGNKRAFREHQMASRGGAYLSIDANHLKATNDLYGHDAGDEVIVGVGNSIRRAIDKTVGSANAKAFRPGGDEAVVHVSNPEHAPIVLRQLRAELEAHPLIRGTHHLSVSVGMGTDFATADHALMHAKTQKLRAIAAAGGDATDRTALAPHSMYAHSLMPGHEGPVPNEDPSPLTGLQPPKVPEKTPLSSSPEASSGAPNPSNAVPPRSAPVPQSQP